MLTMALSLAKAGYSPKNRRDFSTPAIGGGPDMSLRPVRLCDLAGSQLIDGAIYVERPVRQVQAQGLAEFFTRQAGVERAFGGRGVLAR